MKQRRITHDFYLTRKHFKEKKMKKCRYCGSKENLTIDHKIPKVKGGTDDLKNLQCLCERCNKVKSGLYDHEVKRLMKLGNTIRIEKLIRKQNETLSPISAFCKKTILRLLDMLALW